MIYDIFGYLIKVCTERERNKGIVALSKLENPDSDMEETSFSVKDEEMLESNATSILHTQRYDEYSRPSLSKSSSNLNCSEDCKRSVSANNLKMLSLLDFSGHSAYYACHHIFFSPRTFYILVVDMTKKLDSVADEASIVNDLIYSNWTYAGNLLKQLHKV